MSKLGAPEELRVRALTDARGWHAIAADWDRVLRETPGYTGLQSFDFLSTWWECLAEGRALWILAFYEDERLAGIAPLQIVKRPFLGKQYRTVEFLGMTEEILTPALLFPADRAPALQHALVRHLLEHRSEWDAIELDEIAIGSPVLGALRTLAEQGALAYREQPFHDCPYIDFSAETMESFWAKRSRKLLKNVRAAERKLAAEGNVAVDTYAAPATINAGLAQFVEVAKLSWKEQAEIGMAGDASYERFYGRLLAVFAERHEARILVLKVADRPIAATMAIIFDGVYCSLQICHDERYAKFSPGTLLEFYELTGLLQSKSVRRYELLGGALTNKLRWTSAAVSTVCVRARVRDARTRLAELYRYYAKPTAKWLLRRAHLLERS